MLLNALKNFQKTHQLIGHRGSPLKAAENTIQSLRQLAVDGVHCVEFDVKLTKDKQVVVFHDDKINRMTNGRGLLREKTLAELLGFDIKAKPAFLQGEPVSKKIPLFKDYLKECAKLNMQMVVECKADKGDEALLAEQVKNDLAEYWKDDLPTPIISSYSRPCLKALRELYGEQDVWLAANFDSCVSDWQACVDEYGLTSIHLCDDHIEKEYVKELKNAGLGVMVFTINDIDRAQELLDWGVDAVFSDESAPLKAGITFYPPPSLSFLRKNYLAKLFFMVYCFIKVTQL